MRRRRSLLPHLLLQVTYWRRIFFFLPRAKNELPPSPVQWRSGLRDHDDDDDALRPRRHPQQYGRFTLHVHTVTRDVAVHDGMCVCVCVCEVWC